MHRYLEFVSSSAKEAVLFNVAGVVLALAVLLLFRIPLSESFGFIILLESTGLMLIGGALGVAGQATTRKVAEMLTRRKLDPGLRTGSDAKAGLYALTGIILFAEGALMAAILA